MSALSATFLQGGTPLKHLCGDPEASFRKLLLTAIHRGHVSDSAFVMEGSFFFFKFDVMLFSPVFRDERGRQPFVFGRDFHFVPSKTLTLWMPQ